MRLEFARVVFSDSAYYSAVETARVVILFTSRSCYPLDIASATGSADLKMQAKMYNCSPRGVGKNGWLYRPFAKRVVGAVNVGWAPMRMSGCIEFLQNRGGVLSATEAAPAL